VELQKTDKEAILQLNRLESKLNSAVNDAEASTTKNIDRFKKNLKQYVEQLKEETAVLLEQITSERYIQWSQESTRVAECNQELSAFNEKL
jgi:dynein heavy chain, axonemal